MSDERIVIPFPGDTIRLNGILQDALSTLHCATSNLTYKQSIRISSAFLFTYSDVLLCALKSLSAKQEIGFDSQNAVFYMEKNLGNLSDELIFTSLLIASIEKTVALYGAFGFSDEVEVAAEKALAQSAQGYELSDKIGVHSEQGVPVAAQFGFELARVQLHADKNAGMIDGLLRIEDTLLLAVEKWSGTLLSDAEFSSSVALSIAYFRKLFDIDDLTFGDIDAWNMETFDVVIK